MNAFSSAAYWDARYRTGGTSGAGSRGWLAHYKAAIINGFIAANRIRSMIDIGCGDGAQLDLLTPPPAYVGVDVSPTALAACAARLPRHRFVTPAGLADVAPADLTIALDVLYHLTEDPIFTDTIRTIFSWAHRFVVIYGSNVDVAPTTAHVRHRRFTEHVARTEPDWRLLAHLPNPRPFDPARRAETSFADFFIFSKAAEPALIPIPATQG